MVNIIAGSCLMIASSYIGLGIYNYYKTRTKIFADYLAFIEFLINEISFVNANLYEIIDAYTIRYDTHFGKLANQVKLCLQKGENIVVKTNFLPSAERKQLQVFFRTITKLDKDSLISYFKREQVAIESRLKSLREDEAKNGMLAKNLGILIGIGLLILVI